MQLLVPGPAREAGDLRDLYDAPGPYVRGGMLQSLDGVIEHGGRSGPLQRPGDGDVFHALRTVADVVLVGAGTVRAEGYGPVHLRDRDRQWRAERGRSARPPLAVVSRSLAFPDDARWLDGTAFLVTCRAAQAGAGGLRGRARLLVAGDEEVDLAQALRLLAEQGLTRVLCEGGPRLLGDLTVAGLLDEVCLTVSPVLAGPGRGALGTVLPRLTDLRLVSLLQEQDTLLGRWAVRR